MYPGLAQKPSPPTSTGTSSVVSLESFPNTADGQPLLEEVSYPPVLKKLGILLVFVIITSKRHC
jgi:hypothetical protein